MKAAELRSKSVEALNDDLETLLKEQFEARMKNATGQLSRNHVFKEIRRNIARVKTLIHEKQGE